MKYSFFLRYVYKFFNIVMKNLQILHEWIKSLTIKVFTVGLCCKYTVTAFQDLFIKVHLIPSVISL